MPESAGNQSPPPASADAPTPLSPIPVGVHCAECGYDLRNQTRSVCPECGSDIDYIRRAEPLIAWERADNPFKRLLAFWPTVYFVTFKGRQLASEAYRPINYRRSQEFRSVVVLHVFAVLLAAYWGMGGYDSLSGYRNWFGPYSALMSVLFHISALLSVVALTGLPSYFFHPASLSHTQQDRAIALSYYVSGTWAIIAPLFIFLFALEVVIFLSSEGGAAARAYPQRLTADSTVYATITMFLIYRVKVLFANVRLTRNPNRAVWLAPLLLFLDLLTTALILFGVPLMILYPTIIIHYWPIGT